MIIYQIKFIYTIQKGKGEKKTQFLNISFCYGVTQLEAWSWDVFQMESGPNLRSKFWQLDLLPTIKISELYSTKQKTQKMNFTVIKQEKKYYSR
jgi:hypothetical protein